MAFENVDNEKFESGYENGRRLSRHENIDGYVYAERGMEYEGYRERWRRRLAPDTLREEELTHPMHLIIEPVDGCNLRCPRCFRRVAKGRNSGAFLSTDTYRILMREAAEFGVESLALSAGEPLIHRDIDHLLALSGEQGFEDIFLYTNGLLMNRKIIPRILKTVTRLHVSFDATDEISYRERRGGDWDLLNRNVDAFLEMRQARGRRLPLLWVSFIVSNETKDEIPQFVEQWIDKADMLDLQCFVDYERQNAHGIISSLQPDLAACSVALRQMYVLGNSYVFACSATTMRGNLLGVFPERSLRNMWESDKARSLRKAILEKRLPEGCGGCHTLYRYSMMK